MASNKNPECLKEYLVAIEQVEKLVASGDQDSKEYQAAVEKATRLFLLRHGENKVCVDASTSWTYSPVDATYDRFSINEIYDVLNGEIKDD